MPSFVNAEHTSSFHVTIATDHGGSMTTVHEDSMRIIEPHLDDDEELVWAAQPRQGIMLTSADLYLIPFSILWGGFAIFWEVSVLSAGISLFAIFGVPFVLIGLYLMIGRFFVAARRRAQTHYGITNKRVLVVRGKNSEELQSKELSSIGELNLKVRSDGSGTIDFGGSGQKHQMAGMYDAGWMSTGTAGVRIALIPNVRAVHDLLRDARKNAGTGAW